MQLKMQLERTEAILEDEQMQRQKLTAEFEEVRPCLGGPEPSVVLEMVEGVVQAGGCGSGGSFPWGCCCAVGHLPYVYRLVLLSHRAGCPLSPSRLVGFVRRLM